jgi:hypothetical protein
MKTCPECGNESPDMAVVCIKCKYAYPIGIFPGSFASTPAPPAKMDRRPTGWPFIKAGIFLFVITLTGVLFLAGSESEQATMGEWSSLLGGLFSLGLLLFTIGQIQRAIWFLPGGNQK